VIDDTTYPNSRALIDSFTSNLDFPTDTQDRPVTPLTIDSVVISGPALAGFDTANPSLGLPEVHGLPIALRYESEFESYILQWTRQRKWDYPVYSSQDLQAWTRNYHILSMDAAADTDIEVTTLISGGRGFLTMAAVDYTATPDLPANIFAEGDSLILNIDGGILTLIFEATTGTWSFEADNGTVTSGSIDSLQSPQGTQLFGIPNSGIYAPPTPAYSYARSLAAREVVIFFDGLVGPHGIEAIQPELSFHADTSGWYNGPVNSITPLSNPFRGTFNWIPAP
jgi:peptidyl-prolyl cis-trans isomerase A (cyclophilin A)